MAPQPTPASGPSTRIRRIARLVRRHHRLVASAFAALAVLAGITAIRAEPPSVDIVTAARDLPSGHVLAESDLVVEHVDPTLSISTVDLDEAVGRTVVAAISAGEPVTPGRVVDPRDLDDGLSLAAIAVDPSVARVTRAGDVVDVLALSDDSSQPETVAKQVRILVIDQTDQAGNSAILGVATDQKTAAMLAAAALKSRLTVISSPA